MYDALYFSKKGYAIHAQQIITIFLYGVKGLGKTHRQQVEFAPGRFDEFLGGSQGGAQFTPCQKVADVRAVGATGRQGDAQGAAQLGINFSCQRLGVCANNQRLAPTDKYIERPVLLGLGGGAYQGTQARNQHVALVQQVIGDTRTPCRGIGDFSVQDGDAFRELVYLLHRRVNATVQLRRDIINPTDHVLKALHQRFGLRQHDLALRNRGRAARDRLCSSKKTVHGLGQTGGRIGQHFINTARGGGKKLKIITRRRALLDVGGEELIECALYRGHLHAGAQITHTNVLGLSGAKNHRLSAVALGIDVGDVLPGCGYGALEGSQG